MEGIFKKKKTTTTTTKQISKQKHNKNEKKKEKGTEHNWNPTILVLWDATLPHHYSTKDDYLHLALRL